MTDEIKALRDDVNGLRSMLVELTDLCAIAMRRIIEIEGEQFVAYGRMGPSGIWQAGIMPAAQFENRVADDSSIRRLSKPISCAGAQTIAAIFEEQANQQAGTA